MKNLIYIGLWLLASASPLLALPPTAGQCGDLTPARFQEFIATPGDSIALEPQLASVPFWTNAIITNVMTYASGRVFREEMPLTACTVDGRYIVFAVQSKYYHQTMHAIVAYDAKAAALKSYGLYRDEHGHDLLTEGTISYDLAKKTYTITSTYGDFKETTTGSYTDTDDTAKTMVYKNGQLFMTREAITHRL